jgi:hypothetical protein
MVLSRPDAAMTNPTASAERKTGHRPKASLGSPGVGFVVFDDYRACAASNAAWRATVPPAADVFPHDAARLTAAPAAESVSLRRRCSRTSLDRLSSSL